MRPDDREATRLARIERQLAKEDPELAEALNRWRSPRPTGSTAWRWWAAGFVLAGLVFAALAVALGSVGWFVLAVFTAGPGWLLSRGREARGAANPHGPMTGW